MTQYFFTLIIHLLGFLNGAPPSAVDPADDCGINRWVLFKLGSVSTELDKLQNPDSEANLQADNKSETFRKQYTFANNYSKRGRRWWLSYRNTDSTVQ